MSNTARVRKTPGEKATEALRVAQAEVNRLGKKQERLNDERAACGSELTAALARRDYLAQNPDLPKGTPTSGGTSAVTATKVSTLP